MPTRIALSSHPPVLVVVIVLIVAMVVFVTARACVLVFPVGDEGVERLTEHVLRGFAPKPDTPAPHPPHVHLRRAEQRVQSLLSTRTSRREPRRKGVSEPAEVTLEDRKSTRLNS